MRANRTVGMLAICCWVAAALCVPAVAPAAPSAAAAAEFRKCERPETFLRGSIRARGVKCPKARSVIEQFYVDAQGQGPKVRVQGFDCTGGTKGSDQTVRCRNGKRRVNFTGSIS